MSPRQTFQIIERAERGTHPPTPCGQKVGASGWSVNEEHLESRSPRGVHHASKQMPFMPGISFFLFSG